MAGKSEHGAPRGNVAGPDWLTRVIQSLEELIRFALSQPALRSPRQDPSVDRLIRARAVQRVGADTRGARARVIAAEIQESRRAGTGRESESPLPRAPVVLITHKLRVPRIPPPHINDSIQHQHAAPLGCLGAVADCLEAL